MNTYILVKWTVHPLTFLTYTSYNNNYTFGHQTIRPIELELKYKHSANKTFDTMNG